MACPTPIPSIDLPQFTFTGGSLMSNGRIYPAIVDKNSGQSIPVEDELNTRLICYYEDNGELPNGFSFAAPCQLPLWPDEARAMPNCLARSSLFAAIQPGRRKMYDRTKLESRGDASLNVSGKQLDQADADVWKQLLHLSREQLAGERVYFSRYSMLKALGRATGKNDYLWLQKSIERLKSAILWIETKKFQTGFNLIDDFDHDKETGEYWVKLSPKAVRLFDRQEFTLIDWEIRKQIKRGNQLAKWLQTYIASHKAGEKHSINITYLKKWSGQGDSRMNNFKNRALPSALNELERLGIIKNWKIHSNGQVTWLRPEH